MKKFKRAFTIVELVIVIAVIAILAAVLIPTFSNIVRKANVSSDTQLVRNLNTALVVDKAIHGGHKTMQDALDAAFDAGYDLAKINARANQNEILWDSKNDVFCYYNDDKTGSVLEKIEYIPEFPGQQETVKYDYWKIFTDKEFDNNPEKMSFINEEGFSIYYNGEGLNLVNISVGFDAGSSTVSAVNYTSNAGQNVVIRTNGGTLVVNAPADTVAHYGFAEKVDVQAVAMASYDEYGTVPFMTVANGHVAIDSEGFVGGVHLTKKTDTSFDEIVITIASEDMPKFSRDTVNCAVGTEIKVCTVEVENTKDVIYLTNNGIYEQIKLAEVTGNVEGEKAFIEGNPEDSKINTAADQIANNWISSVRPEWEATDTTRKLEDIKNAETIAQEEELTEEQIKTGEIVTEGGKENWVAQVESQLKGSGTKNDPYIVYDLATIQSISEQYEIGYKYYKVKDGIKYIDCTNWNSVKLKGSFDGNGVIFRNLSDALFECVCGVEGNNDDAIIKNFTIENISMVRDGYYEAPVVSWTEELKTFTIDGVTISGYAESVVVSSFVGWSEAKTTIVKNSYSSLTLVSTGSQVSGFVGNAAGTCNVTVEDSIFSGSMACTANNGQYVFAHSNNSATITLKYSDSYLENHKDLYAAKVGVGQCTSWNKNYSKVATASLQLVSNIGDSFTVEKDDSATKAIVTFVVGVNPGNFTGIYQREEIDLTKVSGSTFTTKNIKKFNVVINDGIHATELIDNTQYIRSARSDGTYHGITVRVVQYNSAGAITSVRSVTYK